jgi:hypothetical protein
MAMKRISVNQTGVENKHWKPVQYALFPTDKSTIELMILRVLETLKDPKTWMMFLIAGVSYVVSFSHAHPLLIYIPQQHSQLRMSANEPPGATANRFI